MTTKSLSGSAASQKEKLIDRYGRPVNYLRISLTQRCDHMCFFCHREGEDSPGTEMTTDEIERLVRRGSEKGIRKVKLTGGEALLREDIIEIIRRLSPLTDDLSITTNGTRLAELAQDLKRAGLDRVNVSLHSLKPEVHKAIVGVDDVELVKSGIKAAVDAGLFPVKINMTILKGYNEGEIEDMMKYAGSIGAILQLIELQPMPVESAYMNDLYFSLDEVEKRLQEKATKVKTRSLHGRRQYTIPLEEGDVQVEVVRPHHNSSFCALCTRLRVTSDGKLKPCLLRNDNLVDIHELLQIGADKLIDKELEHVTALREPYWKGGTTK
ncbi:MAG: GTP 3',8-cyclase MoaA [Candidatus Thorarchaeota archaeon]|nr:GTP 3',8-cyclase MoaA [Candidatus Thorarchaeota archaeon]